MEDNSKENSVIEIDAAPVTDNNTPSVTNNSIQESIGTEVASITNNRIFIIPSSIWRLVLSPGTALMFWLAGGLISLLGSMIYVELGSRCPKGSGEQNYLEEAFNYENKPANGKNQLTFNNTPSDEAYEPSIIEHIGNYGNALVLISTIENIFSDQFVQHDVQKSAYLSEEYRFNGGVKVSKKKPEIFRPSKYLLINAAFILVVSPHDAINSYDAIAINFGRTLWGDSGRIFMSILISSSAFGCVSSMVFMGSRAITYAAKYRFIPKISDKLFYWSKTPFHALLLQFCYCTALILLTAVGQSFFVFFAEMSLYSAILFYGVGAVCLLKLKEYYKDAQLRHFKVDIFFIWLYLLCTAFIAVAPFFPIPSSKYEPLNYKSFVPFVASWVPILISVSIWYFHDYKKVSISDILKFLTFYKQ
ncbi:14598_t:CDS:2 [Cetraspora pellucida]|uniref:14598_t:CDS:1 n=1 Tax=Cetraspora pellucida TaxID=1433469 RepID=A0A9N9G3V3_9GLOM|nr:14598_t:CDS:2 [Cetraspora pellucida]